MRKARIIAFYLPQYYPTPTNNKWYGQGFTEWTNVGKARPLYRGHYQPKVPADLGYYDLRYPEVRELQATLAKDAGIEGFCYYHYWFGNGRTELELPFNEVLKLKKPDYPFCLCWANQSWYSKFWNNDLADSPKLIVEQVYNEDECYKHFLSLLDAFHDSRYIKVNGRLLFMIYRPLEFEKVSDFISKWHQYAKEKRIADFYFVGQATNDIQAKAILEKGFDAVNIIRKDDYLNHWKYNNILRNYYCKLIRLFGGAPYHYEYKNVSNFFIQEDGIERLDNIFPTLIPNWDHSPRSGKSAQIFHHSTPEIFEEHLKKAIKTISHKPDEKKILFLKSWNEWGEGNYLEPDIRYGHGFLDVIRQQLK